MTKRTAILALVSTVANIMIYQVAGETNNWAVQIVNPSNVERIAHRHGFMNQGKVQEQLYHKRVLKISSTSEQLRKWVQAGCNIFGRVGVCFLYRIQSKMDLASDEYNGMRLKQTILQGLTGCNISVIDTDAGLRSLLPHDTGHAFEVETTDLLEANALSLDTADVYSNTWGPSDDGTAVGKPGIATKLSLKNRVEKGREGKGSIFVWANGNGGEFGDDCGADGYASSIYTISVGAIGVNGQSRPYNEQCSSKLAMVIVADNEGEYNWSGKNEDEVADQFRRGGTGAAASLASNIIALTLEANPDLTWRDVQYLIVYTANPDLTTGTKTRNGGGLVVSRQYGFGVMDAEAMVSRARHWINVPPQIEESIITPQIITGQATMNTPFQVVIGYYGSIHYLEHVVAEITVLSGDKASRGDITIEIVSPSKTKSVLLHNRPKDDRPGDYIDWPFTSVMFWGEDPHGEWTLTIKTLSYAIITHVELKFLGVSSIPESVSNIPERCHSDCRRGCAGNSSSHCDSCTELRNAYTLQCISQCPSGYTECNGYCYNTSIIPHCPFKTKVEFTHDVMNAEDFDESKLEKPQREKRDGTESTNKFPILLLNDTHKETGEGYVDIGEEFPFGCNGTNYTQIYVSLKGYVSFTNFTGFTPFEFSEGNGLSLVAPFFTDPEEDFNVEYQIYYDMSDSLSQQPKENINKTICKMNPDFDVSWFIIIHWNKIIEDTTVAFEAILATDSEIGESYAIFVYCCSDKCLEYLDNAIAVIGFVSEDGLYRNYDRTVSLDSDKSCSNKESESSNMVYKLTEYECEPTLNDCY